jgi:hypothetical protein
MIKPAIRSKIEKRFGRPIRYSKDCEALAVSIEHVCKERISTTTLKRLFYFAKKIDKPRLFTLDVIAQYVGYTDWESLMVDIEKEVKISTEDKTPVTKEVISGDIHMLHHQVSICHATKTIDTNKIIDLCRHLGKHPDAIPFVIEMIGIAAQQKDIFFLQQVFQLPNIFEETTHSMLQLYYISQSVGMVMRNNPDLAKELIIHYASITLAQQYLIEWFVDEDYLQGYYGILLDAYHLHKKSEIQDQLFYYALKYQQAVQMEDRLQADNYYQKIRKLTIPSWLHRIPAARYVGICLSEDSSHQVNPASTFERIIWQYVCEHDYEDAIEFSFYLCRILFRSKRYDWLCHVIKNFENTHGMPGNKTKKHNGVKVENQLLIYISFASIALHGKEAAVKNYKNVDPNLFDPFIYKQTKQDYITVGKQLEEA